MFTVPADTIFVNSKNTNTIKMQEDIDVFLLLASFRMASNRKEEFSSEVGVGVMLVPVYVN